MTSSRFILRFCCTASLLALAISTSGSILAETEREMIVNYAHDAIWAFHTDTGFETEGLWYVSLISHRPTDVYFLGPMRNGRVSWWTVGLDVGRFRSTLDKISFDLNLDLDPSNRFWDSGLGEWVTNSAIHNVRQRLQGKTVPVKWYFFQAANGEWYIVNAPGYGASPMVSRFASRNGDYYWPSVDVTGYIPKFTPRVDGKAVEVRFLSVDAPEPRFLSFPLQCGDPACSFKYTQGAYTPRCITSVLDHTMESPYRFEGIVTAFTGEKGRGTARKGGCYPKVGGGSFSVNGLYVGTEEGGCTPAGGLNYDGHPGYDYRAARGTEIRAATSGTVVNVQNKRTGKYGMCVPKGIELAGCAAWGYVGIDRGDGYILQYGHLSRVDVSPGQGIKEGEVIGLVGNTRPPTARPFGPHLHFEVLKAKADASYGYTFVDPYGWEDAPDKDKLAKITGIPNVRLWR